MVVLRKVVTIAIVLAVTANSASAALMPCCCIERNQTPKHECCLKKAIDLNEVEASCCAAKTVNEPTAACSLPTIGKRPCCCIRSLPATPPARHTVEPQRRVELQESIITDAVSLADFPPASDRTRQRQPELVFPSSPSLSVLYCVWLK